MDQLTGPTNGTRPDEDEIHLRDVWNLLVRNRILIGVCLVVVVGFVAAYTFHMVPVYRAVTSIRIETQNNTADLPVLDVLQNLSSGADEVETEMQVVQSRTVAEAVVDSLGLEVSLEEPRGVARSTALTSLFVERWAPKGEYVLSRQSDGTYSIKEQDSKKTYGSVSTTSPAALPGVTFKLDSAALAYDEIVVGVTPFDKAVANVMNSISVSRPDREANIITVSYESTDTVLVHEVPNTLAERYIARGQRVRKTQARSTVAFITTQLDTLSRQLRAAEDTLTRFREGQQVVSLSAEADAQVTQLANLQAKRNEIDAERGALQSLVDEVSREAKTADPSAPSPYTRLISFPTLFQNPAASELLRSLDQANDARSDLLKQRTMQDPDVIALTDRIHQIEQQLRTTALTYLDGLTKQVHAYDQTLAKFGTQLEKIPAKEVEQARLQRQTDVLTAIYQDLNNRLQQARILEAVDDASVRVVDPAILPARPIKPRTLLNLLLGLVLGTILGVGVAFTREYMDETIHTREDIQISTGGRPVLGLIPRIRDVGGNGRGAHPTPVAGSAVLGARLVAGRDPRNPVSEAYRGLRTNLTFSNPDKPPRTIVFTSPLPLDGKSTTAANLAITLVQQGIRTLLIDGDLRRGILNSVFGVEREPGLTNVLSGSSEVSDAIHEIDLGESGELHFLASGPYPPNPAEILGSQKMGTLLHTLEEGFELILIDTPPLTVVTDAAVLGTKADGVVLVARANATEKGAMTYAVEQLGNVRAPVLGAVLNDVDFRRDSRYSTSYGKYGYYYQYYFSHENKRQRRREKA